jgi:hypothetical protein
VLFSVQILSDSVAYVVGSLNRILVSTDRGESWQPQATPALPATTLQSVFFLNQSEGWIVGSGGTILHTTDGGLTAAEAGGRTQPKALLLKANYPNPFNPATTFEYELAEAGMVSLRVFDVTGREVALVFEGFQAPGRHLRVWNAGSCASGVYNVRLMVSDRNTARTAEQKVVLVR